MKDWKLLLVMAFAFLIVSAILIVFAVIQSPNSFYGFFLGPSADSYTLYPARILLEIAFGLFTLIMGVGLSILACYICWTIEKSASPNRSAAPEGAKS